MTIGDRIRAKRLELGLTLEDVSKIVGITRQTVQKYESGIVSNIPSDKIELLAKALETTPGYLMGWEQISLADYEKRQKEKPTPVSESGPLNPIAARIMESLDYLSPDQLETIAALTETLRRGKEHK